MNNDKIVKIDDLFRTYKLGKAKISVLRGLNLEVEKGEWLGLLGASGSGKTTLLNLIGCLEKPDKGTIAYNGINISNISQNARTKLRRKKIGFVFQSYHLLPELNVLENVRLPAMINGKFGKTSNTLAENLLVSVGLQDRLTHRPTELSGGEQQRAAIARALVNDPELILADEPTGNLDSKTGDGILELFRRLHEDSSKTIIMVTHNKGVAQLSDRIVEVIDGKI
ncbi:MAG TPA: ABC transporter ATP-binding protein [Victivallales bacterium]|nr:ABC transporter ATP-binding protein [Victivallales bacterium]